MGEETARLVRKGVRLTQGQLTTFLDTLAATGNVRAGARAAGPSVASFYNRRRLDRAFAEAWEAAKVIAYERLEEAMLSYAAAKFTIDPDRAPVGAVEGAVATRLVSPDVSRGDVDLALAMLTRRTNGGARSSRRATPEESDAVIRRKLDAYAQKLIYR
jgi:hypothetical protein